MKAAHGSHVEEMDETDLGEPTSFLDHVYLGCIQREWKPNETVIDKYMKRRFESRISVGETSRKNSCVV